MRNIFSFIAFGYALVATWMKLTDSGTSRPSVSMLRRMMEAGRFDGAIPTQKRATALFYGGIVLTVAVELKKSPLRMEGALNTVSEQSEITDDQK